MIELSGRTVFITGASRGIGKALALAFSREKVKLAITARGNMDMLEKTADEARKAGSEVLTLKMDMKSEKDVRDGFKRTLDEFGSLDVLINNAGTARPGLVGMLSEENWDEVIDVNLKGVFLCSREAIRPMSSASVG